MILAVTGLVSLFRAEPASIRGPRWMWVLIILLGNLIGSVAYFVAGGEKFDREAFKHS